LNALAISQAAQLPVAPPAGNFRCISIGVDMDSFEPNNVLAAKISLVPSGKSPLEARPSRARSGGALRIVTNVERGMRWTRLGRRTSGSGADGEVVWA
jgi:hypothetical protein